MIFQVRNMAVGDTFVKQPPITSKKGMQDNHRLAGTGSPTQLFWCDRGAVIGSGMVRRAYMSEEVAHRNIYQIFLN